MKHLLLTLLLILLAHAQYTVTSVDSGSSYLKLTLNYTGPNDYYVKPKSKVVKQLVFHFKALTYSDFSFKIYDPNSPRFEVPQGTPFPTDQQANFSYPLAIASYKINYTAQHFSFLIQRKSTNAVLFDSSVVELQFSQYYIQFGTILDSKTLVGYSQRFSKHLTLRKGTWTVWNKDNGQVIDEGNQNTGGLQTYGYYPVYLTRELSGLHHIGYFRTSNALDVQVESFSNTSFLKIYRTIGGIIDFRFLLGQKDPEELLNKFHNFVGAAHVAPFWAFGFHQCRWGYNNVTKVENVLEQYEKNGLPLDTIWTDIDYMHEFQTFTVDTARFPLDRLLNITKRYRYIPIIEPAARNRTSHAFEQGSRRNVFIQAAEGGNFVGKVWAGDSVFVDNFHPNASQFWLDMLQYLYNQVPFSGLWLDMNELSNECDGPCTTPKGTTEMDYQRDLPYQPGGKNVELSTIPLNCTHFGKRREADVHPFFGLMQAKNAFDFLKTKGRPFMVTRSNTLGSSRYAIHWTGDNYANFTFLRLSIVGNFHLGFWGEQMVGSDICGFGGNATEEICARFFQLGALYPFARNHNQIKMVDQEPYALGPKVLECSKKNLKLRYSLLKGYYREFIVRKGTGTIFRPLYLQFYEDPNVLGDEVLETQFLIGESLMSAPIVQQGKTKRTAYFPGDIWYNLYTGEKQNPGALGIIENNITDLVPLFLRNGYTFFRQNVDNVTKTTHLDNRFEMVAAFKLVSTNSTSTQYTSKGGLLSLGDYDNDANIQKCISQDCEFQITATLTILTATKQKELVLQTRFQGKLVRFEQTIFKFTLFVEGADTITHQPETAIVIYREGQQKITFT